MIEVKEVVSRRQKREFIDFPNKLYKGCPYYVPPLYLDERKIFTKDYIYYETCEAVYFNAYRDGVMAGRISGILQHSSNDKWGQKRVRFTRFDVIDDFEVARALFGAVENWAAAKGMEEVVGPLGFSDLEREGLLIEGFDQMSTFEEAYNYEYYGKFIEKLGYAKEVDWVEYKVSLPDEDDGTLEKMADFIMKRYDLHFGTAKNTNDFLRRYGDRFFDLLDRAYRDIYGTVPFTEGMKEMMYDNFRLIIDLRHVAVILDKDENPVCLGICFPSIAKAVQKSNGHLTPAAIVRLLRTIRHPEVIDLGLIGVEPSYMNRGIGAVVSAALLRMLREDGVKYAETNLNLETNYDIQNMWKRFKAVQHKRRRAYVKSLCAEENAHD